MQEYIDRLCLCGIRKDDAWVLVNDFLRELDWNGLADYVNELEKVHRELTGYVD